MNTNGIEGAWKHATDYFRKMSGHQSEGHLAKLIGRLV